MLTQLTTILVMISLLFGGAGATVYAAQDSLPDDMLYPVKTASEDVSLALSSGTQAQLKLALKLAYTRMGEIEELVNKGEGIPLQVQTRLNMHMEYALKLAAGMEGDQQKQALQQVMAKNQEMLQSMAQLMLKNPGTGQSIMTQLQKNNQGVEQMLQNKIQLKTQLNKPEAEPVDEAGLSSETVSDTQKYGNCEDCEPVLDGTGPSYGPGPGNQGGLQQPDEGYGPGICDTCDPALDGTGPGPGPNYQGGNENSNGGYGPGTCDTCEPALDGTGPGPGPNYQGGEEKPNGGYGPGNATGSNYSPGPAAPNQGSTQPYGPYGPGSENQNVNTQPDQGNGTGQQDEAAPITPPESGTGSSGSTTNQGGGGK